MSEAGPALSPGAMTHRRPGVRERLAQTEWGEVAIFALMLAVFVSLPFLYVQADGVDVVGAWTLPAAVVALPVVLVAAWFLSEHFWNVAEELEQRRSGQRWGGDTAALGGWCPPDRFAETGEAPIVRPPPEFQRALGERTAGATPAEPGPGGPA